MSRFAQTLIERLQWTRLRLLDVYGDADAVAEPRLTASGADGAAAVPGARAGGGRPPTPGRSTLEPLAGDAIAPLPGQFTMLYAFGVGEIPISVIGRRRRRACSPTRSARSAR